MTNKKELYLHVGTVKTGTTALQEFFKLNHQVLQDHDISYPVDRNNRFAHHCLSWALALSEGKTFSSKWPVDLASPEDEWNFLKNQSSSRRFMV